MKKLFIAVAANQGLEAAAAQVVKKLKVNADQKGLDIRWVPPENFHVTVVFLGPTAEERLPEIESLLQKTAEQRAPFFLKIEDLGAFPDEFSSRVLWFGVQNSKALRGLQADLADTFRQHRYPIEEREYTPHLTIARLRNPHKTKDLTSPFARKKFAKILVQEIVLYESVGSFPFPKYKPLKIVALSGPDESPQD